MKRWLDSLIAVPVYHRVVARWSRLHAWHWAALSLLILVGTLIVFGIPIMLYLPCPPASMPNFSWSTGALGTVLGLLTGQAVLGGLLAAAAVILGSAAAAPAAPDPRGDLLLLTPLPARALVLARLAAVLRVLAIPLGTVIAVRLLLLGAFQPHLLDRLYTFTGLMPSRSGCPFVWSAPPVIAAAGRESYSLLRAAGWRLDLLRMKPVWPLWAASFVLHPALDLALFAGISIAAVSRAPTHTQALVWSLVAGLGIAGGGYAAERLGALTLSSLWLPMVNPAALSVWLPPWDFGGGLSPPGVIPSFWTQGLPVITPGFFETSVLFELLWLASLMGKIGVLWLAVRIAAKGA